MSSSFSFIINDEQESNLPSLLLGAAGSALQYDPLISVGWARFIGEGLGFAGDVIGKSVDGTIDTRDWFGIAGSFSAGFIAGAGAASFTANPLLIFGAGIAGGFVGDEAVTAIYDNITGYLSDSIGTVTTYSIDASTGAVTTQTHTIISQPWIDGIQVDQLQTIIKVDGQRPEVVLTELMLGSGRDNLELIAQSNPTTYADALNAAYSVYALDPLLRIAAEEAANPYREETKVEDHEDGSVTKTESLIDKASGVELVTVTSTTSASGLKTKEVTHISDDTKQHIQDNANYRGSGTQQPIILDLDGDGIDVSFGSNAAFDLDGDGYREQTAWASADDGFLVVDLDENGNISADGGDGDITQAKELAFASWAADGSTDLQGLAEARDAEGNLIFDSNADGVLDANDNIWSSMKVFQDLDQDGEVDEGELRTLDDWGISQINLSYDDGSSFAETDDNVSVLGNTLHGTASFVMNGNVIEGGVGDVSLAYNEFGWRRVETDSGYRIEFESGEGWTFWDGETAVDANADLAAGGYAGAYGDARSNVLDGSGLTEDAVIDGGAGNDRVLGGSGGDLLSGGDGVDTIHAGAGNDVVFADAADNVAAGNVTGGEGYDQLNMTEDAVLNIADLGSLGFEAVEAGEQADRISALDDDTGFYFSGNGGDDTLTTAGGADVLSGGAGSDSLTSGAGADRLFGGAGSDRLNAGDDADFLAGGSGSDTLLGGGGNDTYFYQRGDGADLIYDQTEGTFMERYEYTARVRQKGKRRRYTNELRTKTVEMTGEVDGGIDTLEFGYGIDIEDILFSRVGDNAFIQIRELDDINTEADEGNTVSVDDNITIQDWSDDNNRIEYFSLANGMSINVSQIKHGQTGHAEANSFIGTSEGDWLNAGGGNDTLHGNAGNDVMIAGDGNDDIAGGDGKDAIFAGDGDDIVSGDAGNDYIMAGAGNDTVYGGAGDDTLFGEEGDDLLEGGEGNDTLLGGEGSDTLRGGAGDDVYIYVRGDGRDVIQDEAGAVSGGTQLVSAGSDYLSSLAHHRWLDQNRTVQQMHNGWDVLQFGYSIKANHVFYELQGNNLVMGIRQFAEDGTELTLDQMDDVVTVEDWTNLDNRIEELRFGDGFDLDISQYNLFQSGYQADDNFSGSDAGDLLAGGGGNDTLTGNGGNDALIGGTGSDLLGGGAGNDDLQGGSGDDTLSGGAGSDYLKGGFGHDSIEGGDGKDMLVGGQGNDTLHGGRGNDVYFFNRGDGHDVIDESAFATSGTDDISYGTDGFSTGSETHWTGGKNSQPYEVLVWINDTRTGANVRAIDGGDDVLQLGNYISFADLIATTQGSGLDASLKVELEPIIEGTEASDSITIDNWGTQNFRVETIRFANDFAFDISKVGFAATGTDEANLLNASSATLLNGDGAWLSGKGGNDTINGSGNADIIVGGKDNDRLEGGAGDDVYIYSRGDGADRIFDSGSSSVGSDRAAPGGDKILFDFGISYEDLIIKTEGSTLKIYVADMNDMSVPLSELSDHITIENWTTGSNKIEVLQFASGQDVNISGIRYSYLGSDLNGSGSATAVNDSLYGSGYADWMDGFAGNDQIDGRGGDDFIFGREGNDAINAGSGHDIVIAGVGNDTVYGSSGNDFIMGNAGNDRLFGEDNNDVLVGGQGNDYLDGGRGSDEINGGAGDDTIVASADVDIIKFGIGDGNDVYKGNTSYKGTDVFIFEDGLTSEDLWFERIENSLVIRIHGADDTLTLENWFYLGNPEAYVQGFQAADGWLSYQQVNSLVSSMKPFIADLNDGTTMYGILPGDAPETVLDAIESAWIL